MPVSQHIAAYGAPAVAGDDLPDRIALQLTSLTLLLQEPAD